MLQIKCRAFLVFLFCVSICIPAFAAELKQGALTWQGVQRSYSYYIPEHLDLSTPHPLMLVLHGLNTSGASAAENWGFIETADLEGFIVVFPDGLDGEWNDGRDESFIFREHYNVDDVGFLSAVIDLFTSPGVGGDAARTYMVGVSNGGMMTLRMGCEKAGKLTAIAPLLASLPQKLYRSCLPEKPLPLIMMNGTKDSIIPFEGGDVTLAGQRYGEVVGVQSTLSIWLQRNACDLSPIVADLEQYFPTREAKGISTELYAKCGSGKAVMLYRMEEGGHSIPSFKHKRPVFRDVKVHNFNAAGEIWDFFKRYKK